MEKTLPRRKPPAVAAGEDECGNTEKGSVSESGWIIPQNAPIEPVGLIDRTYDRPEIYNK
ncbi:DUF4765 family protein [Escherichia coli]